MGSEEAVLILQRYLAIKLEGSTSFLSGMRLCVATKCFHICDGDASS